jgi:4-hydroxy-3-polyprenylbenzoate decarboxylase
MAAHERDRLIVAITGATGVVYGIELLKLLRETSVEAHVVISAWAARTLLHETDYTKEDVSRLAGEVYAVNDMGAAISSGSFLTRGMIVAPCSMRTLGAIANGVGDNLIHRAADVVLKERRSLVLAVRESPLSAIHLKNMLSLSRMGVSICPLVPAFYTRPATLGDVVRYSAARLLDQVGIHIDTSRWDGRLGTRAAVSSAADEE